MGPPRTVRKPGEFEAGPLARPARLTYLKYVMILSIIL